MSKLIELPIISSSHDSCMIVLIMWNNNIQKGPTYIQLERNQFIDSFQNQKFMVWDKLCPCSFIPSISVI